MFDKLDSLESRFIEIEDSLVQSSLSGSEFATLSKERSDLEPVVTVFRQYKAALEDLKSAKEMLVSEEAEMREFGRQEVDAISRQIELYKKELTTLLLPSDPNDAKNIILEIRAGTGGDEAGIFCGDLLRMYTRYAEKQNWNTSFLSSMESPKGGYKEVILSIEGKKVYSQLKFESGVHRVQRVPLTESQGRVHTSACTVAVLPEADDVEVEIKPSDLRIDTYRSSGSGGQHVNTTDSAVRLTHLPTGLVVACQAERSQLQNKLRALELLKTKLLLKKRDDEIKKLNDIRGEQHEAGWGRQIRSYVLQPYQLVKDARTNIEIGNVQNVLDGEINIFIKEYLKWRRQGLND